MKKILFFSILLLSIGALKAQEFRTNVNIQAPSLQLSDPKVFNTLEGTIREFFNNTKFSDKEYEEFEKINLDINMTVREEISATRFKVDFAIQATRPVYGSNYDTPIITHLDKDFGFDYEQFQPIDFSENSYINNLSSLLSFYAYMVLGLDADSYAPYGGETYFLAAQQVVNNVPQNLEDVFKKGWGSLSNNNRYWLADNMLTPRLRDFRQAWYDYHRQGLDIASSDIVTARAIMTEALKNISVVNRNRPNSTIIQVFANTKSSELIEIYKQGTPEEQNQMIQTMAKVDPAQAGKYRQVR